MKSEVEAARWMLDFLLRSPEAANGPSLTSAQRREVCKEAVESMKAGVRREQEQARKDQVEAEARAQARAVEQSIWDTSNDESKFVAGKLTFDPVTLSSTVTLFEAQVAGRFVRQILKLRIERELRRVAEAYD